VTRINSEGQPYYGNYTTFPEPDCTESVDDILKYLGIQKRVQKKNPDIIVKTGYILSRREEEALRHGEIKKTRI
jgi:hypothetical protein